MKTFNYNIILTIGILLSTIFSYSQNDPKWINVEISDEMIHMMQTLDESEQHEQIRDWITYSYINTINLDDETRMNVLYDKSPTREMLFSGLANLDYGQSRFLFVENDVHVLVPENDSERKVLIARAADEFRLIKNKFPNNIHIINYEMDINNREFRFMPTEKLLPSVVYSDEYGYVEKTVQNKNELQAFIRGIDDVVYVEKKENSIKFGGRKYGDKRTKNITLEDVAVIYQADRDLADQYVERLDKRGLYDEYLTYKQRVAEDLGGEQVLKELCKDERLEDVIKSVCNYNAFVDLYIKEVNDDSSLNIGFSLDPATKYNELSESFEHVISGDSVFLVKWYNQNVREDDKKAIIFQIKEEKEKFGELIGNYRALIGKDTAGLYEYEKDLKSMFCLLSDNRTSEKKKDIYQWLIRELNISEERINDDLDNIVVDLYNASQKYKDILGQVSSQIKTEKEEKRKLRLYYQLVNTINNKTVIDTRFSDSQEQKVVNDFILQVTREILQKKGFFKVDSLDVQLWEVIKDWQEYVGITPTGFINNESFFYLTKEDAPLFYLGKLLRNLVMSHQYQEARYDGGLQGTEVGMTLYYTDLLMKLWSFNFKNSIPKSKDVFGFVSKTQYPISLTHRKYTDYNSSTRSWLGPAESGRMFYENGNKLLFAHSATKIYNASPSDLFPGAENEMPANYSSMRFANWWNSNYSQVADFEEEFHRLNQITKWTTITHWTKEQGLFEWLSDKSLVNTDTLDFEYWYQNSTSLKVKVPIPFLDKKKLGETTECIDIIHSEPYLPYENELLVYSFSGGVSLGTRLGVRESMKLNKNALLVRHGKNRKNINYSTSQSPKEITFNNGTKYNLSNNNKVVITPKKTATFKNSKSESFNISKIDRTLNKNGFFSQKIHSSKDVKVQSEAVKIVKISNNKIKLSIEKGEIFKLNNFMEDISKISFRKGLDGNIATHKRVELSFSLPNNEGYLVKFKDSNTWVKINSTKIPMNPNDNAIYGGPNIRSPLGRGSYLDASFMPKTELKRVVEKYRYLKINNVWAAKSLLLSNKPPTKIDNKLYFHTSSGTTEVLSQEGTLFIRNSLLEEVFPIGQALRKSDVFFTKRITSGKKDIEGVIFSSTGNKSNEIYFSSSPIKKTLSIEEKIIVDPQVRAILKTGNISNPKLEKGSILVIPKKATAIHKDIVNFMNTKIKENPKFRKVWEGAGEVSIKDVEMLKKIAPENFDLTKSYFQFKNETGNLKLGQVVIDPLSHSKQPQVLLKKAGGSPELITLNTSNTKNMGQIMKEIGDAYSASSNNRAYDVFQPLDDILSEIIKITGSKEIITKNTGKINFEVVNKVLGKHPDVRFYKDQPEISTSISTVQDSIFMDFDRSIVLTTTNFDNTEFPEIRQQFEVLKQSELNVQESITIDSFLSMLYDNKIQQIYLIIRATESGLVFSDGLLTYEELKAETDWIHRTKESIYIITNQPDTLEAIFADIGLFKNVITSGYQKCSNESLSDAITILSDFVNPVRNEIIVKKRFYNKLLKSTPELNSLLGGKTKKEGKKIRISIGQISSDNYHLLPIELKKEVDKQLGNSKEYKPNKVGELIDNIQKSNIEKMKKSPNGIKMQKLRGIPHLKVDITVCKSSGLC